LFKKIDKLFYCYQGIAYKIDTRGGKLVFYSKFNLLFKDNNPQLKLDDIFKILITDEPIENYSLTLAK
jgi:hypothetical protein